METVDREQNGICSDMLVAHWFLSAWIEKLLSSDVSEVSSRAWPDFVLFQLSRCKTEQKQSLLISQTQPVTVILLSSFSWNSPFSPTWPPITILLTLTCCHFSSHLKDWCVPFFFFFHKKHPLSLRMLLCVTIWDVCPSSLVPSCHSHSLTAD